METAPAATAVTRPDELTDAIVESPDDHSIERSSVLPQRSNATAVAWVVLPTSSVLDPSLTWIVAIARLSSADKSLVFSPSGPVGLPIRARKCGQQYDCERGCARVFAVHGDIHESRNCIHPGRVLFAVALSRATGAGCEECCSNQQRHWDGAHLYTSGETFVSPLLVSVDFGEAVAPCYARITVRGQYRAEVPETSRNSFARSELERSI